MADLTDIRSLLKDELPLYLSNKIIEAHYSLPVVGQRLMFAYISKLTAKDCELPILEISVREISQILGTADPNYSQVKKHCDDMLTSLIKIETERSGKPIYRTFQWFSDCEYQPSEGIVKMKIHDNLKPFLLLLKGSYTKLISKQVMQFRSEYAIRIYMLCKQYQAFGRRKISVAELRKKVELEEGKLKLYADFKRNVLLKAQKEINAKSDIEIQIIEFKVNKRVDEIEFIIEPNTKNALKDTGVESLYLKSVGELAGMVHNELKKKYKIELNPRLYQDFADKDVLISFLCEIYRGAFDDVSIGSTADIYFRGVLKNISDLMKTNQTFPKKTPIERIGLEGGEEEEQ